MSMALVMPDSIKTEPAMTRAVHMAALSFEETCLSGIFGEFYYCEYGIVYHVLIVGIYAFGHKC